MGGIAECMVHSTKILMIQQGTEYEGHRPNGSQYTHTTHKMLEHCNLMRMYIYSKSMIYFSECRNYICICMGKTFDLGLNT